MKTKFQLLNFFLLQINSGNKYSKTTINEENQEVYITPRFIFPNSASNCDMYEINNKLRSQIINKIESAKKIINMLAYDFGTNTDDEYDIVSALINAAQKEIDFKLKLDSGGKRLNRLYDSKKKQLLDYKMKI